MQAKYLTFAMATGLALSATGCSWLLHETGSSSSASSGSSASSESAFFSETAPSADQVRQAQTQLQSRGYDVGSVDGVLGDQTRAALRQFQAAQGMEASGRLDARTMSALGVGAKTSMGGSTSGNSQGAATTRGGGATATGGDSANAGTSSGASGTTGSGAAAAIGGDSANRAAPSGATTGSSATGATSTGAGSTPDTSSDTQRR